MASGLPVIAVNWGGPGEYLDDNCGILIEPNNPEFVTQSICDAITCLSNDRALAAKLGSNGRKKVEDHYDWDKKIDVMLSYYNELVSGNCFER